MPSETVKNWQNERDKQKRKYIRHGFIEHLTENNSAGVPIFYFRYIILTNNTEEEEEEHKCMDTHWYCIVTKEYFDRKIKRNTESPAGQGPVSRKPRKLFGSVKP